jgi:hypothetical protein
MLKKKKIQQNQARHFAHNFNTPQFSRLEEITHLEKELVSLLGPKNVEIDEEADLFSRLEEIYLCHLQTHPLGFEVL